MGRHDFDVHFAASDRIDCTHDLAFAFVAALNEAESDRVS
jgi:hypothetical protein